MPNWLGDAVMASPIISLIKKKWPGAKLTLFGKPAILTLFEHDPNVDAFIPIEKQELAFQLIYKLREKRFDCGLLLTNSFSSALQMGVETFHHLKSVLQDALMWVNHR